jgi:hypothetical protein
MQVGLHETPLGVQHWPWSQTSFPEHEQFIVCPQPSEKEPQLLPQLTGVQHDPCGSHVCPEGQSGEHWINWPHPLSTEIAQRPVHGLGLGVQHVPASASQTPLFTQSPLTPQVTGCWQLSSACPHCRVAHGSPVGTQPQVLFVQVVLAQPPHGTMMPQLSLTMPQRPLHQVGSL